MTATCYDGTWKRAVIDACMNPNCPDPGQNWFSSRVSLLWYIDLEVHVGVLVMGNSIAIRELELREDIL